jgi:hypothetical protein
MRKQPWVVSLVLVAIAIVAASGAASGQTLPQPDRIAQQKAGPPATYGTSQESFYTIGEWEFAPIRSVQTYWDTGAGGVNLLRYSTNPAGGFIAPVHVPDGAMLTTVTYNVCDSSTTDQHWSIGLVSAANLNGQVSNVGPTVISLSNVANPCVAYMQDISGLQFVVDSQSSRLAIMAVTPAADITNAIAGVTVGYRLQVSPAPGTATFGDVPTGHPFFQYVEALAKSGITGGCGSGNYCPDSPLTRGQMAVFLSKALGLQWP